MHVLIVEFELQGIGCHDYEALTEQVAPAYAQIPGLIEKVWLVDAAAGRAGGVYKWAGREACDAYLGGELFAALQAQPALANVRLRRYDVLEAATAVTRGVPAVAA